MAATLWLRALPFSPALSLQFHLRRDVPSMPTAFSTSDNVYLHKGCLHAVAARAASSPCAVIMSAFQTDGALCQVATPRVLKPGEERLIRLYLRLGPDALLLRSAGLLHQLTQLGVPTGGMSTHTCGMAN